MLLSFQFHQTGEVKGIPRGGTEKYLPEEESRENPGNLGMFLFVLVRASQPIVVLWGGEVRKE